MRKFLITKLFLLLTVVAFAQPQFYNSNIGATGNVFPLNSTTNKVQWIYEPGIFNSNGTLGGVPAGVGLITHIYIRSSAAVASTTFTNFTVRLAQNVGTQAAWTSAVFNTPMTTVLGPTSQTFTGIVAAGWVQIPLSIPFLYDPTLSLVVEIEQSAYTSGITTLQQGIANKRIWGTFGSAVGTNFGSGWADMGIDLAPAGPCTAPPTAGTATATPSTPCVTQNIQLNLTGNSTGVGQTYVWESSPNIGGPWTPIGPASSGQGFVTPATTTLYYRCAVTCSGNTQFSVPVLVTVPPAFPAGTYTINSALPTGGTNFQTFNAAIAAISCGIAGSVVFNVAPASGPYNEQVTIPQIPNMSAVNTVTINGNNEILTFNATAANPSTILMNGTDFFTINNLTVVGTNATNALVVHLFNNADNNTFNNCTFTCTANSTGTLSSPFSISGTAISATATGPSGSNNIVNNCVLNSGYYGYSLSGPTAAPFPANNQIKGCTINDPYNYGVYSAYNTGLIVDSNIIQQPTRTSLTTFYGVFATTSTASIKITRNRIRNIFLSTPTNTSTSYGIYVSGSGGTLGNEVKIENNIIHNITNAGILYGIYVLAINHVHVYHNTVSIDHTTSTATGATRGIWMSNTAPTNSQIRNNIVTISRGGTGIKHCLYYAGAGQVSNNNVLVMNAAAGTNRIGWFNADFITLANWQAANAAQWDQQSVDINPVYAAPASPTFNFTPTVSGVNNIGGAVSTTIDINGNPRSAVTPDPGAIEFSLAPIDMAMVQLTAPDNSGCYGSTQNVTVTVQNAGNTVMDFSVTPLNLGALISGPVNTTLTGTINSGTLAVNGTLSYTFPTTINMTVYGNYTIRPYLTFAGDPNQTNDTLTVLRNSDLIPGTVSSSLASVCVSGTPTLTVAGAYGGTIQWQEAPTVLGPWTNVGTNASSYVPASPITQSTFYRVQVGCAASMATAVSNTVNVQVNNPQITSVTHDSICAPATATLGATASPGNVVKWYAAQTGGSPLATGNTYTTPVLTNSTTYWAEAGAAVGGGIDSFGMPINTANTCCIYHHMSAVNVLTTMEISGINIVATNPVNTVSSFDVFYRMGNYNLTPGANTSSAGWISLGTYAVPSAGTGNWTALNFPSPIPVAQGGAISFYVYPTVTPVAPAVSGTLEYTTSGVTTGSPFVSNADLQILGGHRGSLFNCTSVSGLLKYQVKYSTGCNGTRVPVEAVVNPTPVITASPTSVTVCQTQQTTLSGGGAGVGGTYSWTGGIQDATAFTPAATTVYTVTGTDANGCSGTATASVLVNPVVSGTATASPTTVCVGGTSTLSGTATATCFGNSNGFAGAYAPVNWTQFLTNSNGFVNFNSAPVSITLTSGNNASGNPGTTNYRVVIPCPGTVSFNWSYTNLGLAGDDFPQYRVNSGAVQTFSGYNFAGSQNQSGSQSISVNAGDTLTLIAYTTDNDAFACTIQLTNFSAPAAPVTGTATFWDAATGGVNLGASPALVTVPNPGINTFYAEFTTDVTGCVNPVRVPVTVNANNQPFVLAQVSPGTTICEGQSVTLTAFAPGGGTYSWQGGTTPTTGTPVSSSPVSNTTYTVTVQDGNGCLGTATVSVEVNPTPVVTISSTPTSPIVVCTQDQQVTLTASGAASYSWSGGVQNGVAFTAVGGTTTYTVTGTSLGCNGTATIDVTGNVNPTVTAVATPSSLCFGNTSDLQAGGASTYVWDLGPNTSLWTVQPSGNTTYTVTGTDGNGCSNSATVGVLVSATNASLPPATSTNSNTQPDGSSVVYTNSNCDLIASIDDGIGGNVLGNVSAIVQVDASAPSYNGQPYVRRWYDITPSSNGPATVTLYIEQSDFANYNTNAGSYAPLPTSGNNADPNIGNIRITQVSGGGLGVGTPTVLTPSVNWNGSYWELSFAVSGFSQFYVHGANPGNIPLPAMISDFSGRKAESSNELSWTTVSEQNNSHFVLQYATDGIHFSDLARVESKAPNGTSAQVLHYRYEHNSPAMGHNYYRLLQVDIDGQSSMNAKVVDLIWGTNGSTVSVYPNPTKGMVNIDLYTSRAQNTSVKVLDMSGRVVKQIQARSESGVNKLTIDLSEVANGVYSIQVYENDRMTHVDRIRKND